jgi:hypothetical protein
MKLNYRTTKNKNKKKLIKKKMGKKLRSRLELLKKIKIKLKNIYNLINYIKFK